MAVAACFAAAQAQTNEKRGSINLWGYVVDSFPQSRPEGAKVTLMTADSTVVDSIHPYPLLMAMAVPLSLPAKTQNIILRSALGKTADCAYGKCPLRQRFLKVQLGEIRFRGIV